MKAGAALGRTFAQSLPPAWSEAALCDDWDFRVGACARTWARPHAVDALMDLVPLGTVKGGWAFLEDGGPHKRVLGAVVEVSDDDNVKQARARRAARGAPVPVTNADANPFPSLQDISIDVYGRGDHADAVDGGLDAAKTGADGAAAAPSTPAVGRARVAKAAAAKGADDDLDSLLGL